MGIIISEIARKCIVDSDLYPLLRNFKPNFTEVINTNPILKKFGAYPDADHKNLKTKFAQHMSKISVTKLSESNILFTAGCTEGIDLLVRTFCEPSIDAISVLTPAIPLFEDIAKKNNVGVTRVFLEGGDFNIIPDQRPISSKITFVCNPNNPVGSVISKKELERLLQGSKAIVAVDETYIDFSEEDSSVSLIDRYKNLVVLRSFSKSWGLAGLRAGSIIAHKEVIDLVRRAQLPFSVSTPALEGIEYSLKEINEINEALIKIKEERTRVYDALKNIDSIERVFQSFTNFILLKIQRRDDFLKIISDKNRFYISDMSVHLAHSIRFSIYDRNHNDSFLNSIKSMNSSG